MSEDLPDTEGVVKTYLEAQLTLPKWIGFGVPKGATEQMFPMIIITRIGGGEDTSEVPLDLALLQFDIWARKDRGRKAEAFACTRELRGALKAMRGADGTATFGAQIESITFSPDPQDSRARYVVTAQVPAMVVAP